jgi:hypothetical protein
MFPIDLRMSRTTKILLGLTLFAASIMQMQISQDMAKRDIFRGHSISLSKSEASAEGDEG